MEKVSKRVAEAMGLLAQLKQEHPREYEDILEKLEARLNGTPGQQTWVVIDTEEILKNFPMLNPLLVAASRGDDNGVKGELSRLRGRLTE